MPLQSISNIYVTTEKHKPFVTQLIPIVNLWMPGLSR
jgi:hypothetical protein